MRRLLSFIVAGLVVTSAVAVGRSFYEFNQTQPAPVTAQTSPVSMPVAQDKTVTIDINDRFEYWHNIGWETVPKIFDAGDPNDVEDDVSNRAVRDDLIFNGWQRMIDYSQEMVDVADARMIQLHNPFGSASFVDQDLENGAEFPVPGPDGEIDGKPGRRIMQFSQYTDSLHEWTMNESWAAEHWGDFDGQPAMHATLGLWSDFLDRNPGVRVRFYVGGPHNDYYVKNLVAEYGTSSQEVWDHIWANLVPYLLVGIRDIGVDNSSSLAARNSGVTDRMMDVLFYPEHRDPVLDADLLAAIGNEPVEVMIEAKPWKDAHEQFDYDVLAEEYVWKAFTAPNNPSFPPDDYYIRGRGVRLLTRETLDDTVVPVRTADRLIALSKDVLTSGHYVMVPYFWAKLTGVETTENLLDGVGLFEMPTQINLLSSGNSETDTFTIIKEPDHGTLMVNPNYPYIYHYTSRSDFTGTDSFTYQISNELGQTSLPATVTIQQTGHSYTPVCGNTFIETGEECDDGNTNNHDGCSSACTAEAVSYAYAWKKPSVDLPHIVYTPQVDGAGGDYMNEVRVQAIVDAVSTQPEVAIWGNAHHDHVVPWHIPSDVGNLDNARTADGTYTEHNGIWWDNWTAFTALRFNTFLQIYRNLGGPPIDYIQLDVEHGFSNWSFLGNQARADAVENDPRFAAVRTEMLARGIEWKGNFYDTINYQNGTINYLIWNQYATEKRKEYIEEAYLDVARQYYPDVEMGNWEGKYYSSEFPMRDFNGHRNWLGGGGAIVGTLQNAVFYFQLGNIQNVKLDGTNLYERTPFNAFRFGVNKVRAPMLTDASTPTRVWFGREQWQNEIGSQNGYDTGVYYEEAILHTLLAGADGIDYWNTSGPHDINVQAVKMNGLLEEFDQLTRFSLERATLNEELVPWDAPYVLSGMQTGNAADDYRLYRLTPNIDNESDPINSVTDDIQDYVISSSPPVFTIGDTTIVFPDGEIITQANSFAENGFWVQQSLDAAVPTIDTDCTGIDCIDDTPDFSNSPCIFCYLSPNVDVELQHQQAWPTADLSSLGIRTGDTVSINSYVFGVGGNDSFATVVGRTESSIRSILQNQIENGVFKALGIDSSSTKTVIIDIEGPIHPIKWNSLAPDELQQALDAYAMRVRVVRDELPNAKLLIWGIPALHNQQQNVDGSHWQNFLSIYEKAKIAGVFEHVDGLAVQMYVGLGRDDLSFFKVFDGAIQATLEVAGRLTTQDGTPLDIYPVISPVNFNGSSNNAGEFHLPEDFAKTVAIINEYASIVDGILIWVAGTGNVDQINYLSTLPYCGPDVCSTEPTDVCAAACALQSDTCSDGIISPEDTCDEVVTLTDADSFTLSFPEYSGVTYSVKTWPTWGPLNGAERPNDITSGDYVYTVDPEFAGVDMAAVSVTVDGVTSSRYVYIVADRLGHSCGDGVRRNEQCDDGNMIDGDGCTSYCAIETGYTCSEDNTGTSSCSICGDGQLSGSEECDDGNVVDGDGCTWLCKQEAGFTCDNNEPTSCQTECGDGIKTILEACDDGNGRNGDGCNSLCQIETGYVCSGFEPSLCLSQPACNDGIDNDGDGMIDAGDPGCSGDSDTDESGEERQHNFTVTLSDNPDSQSQSLFQQIDWRPTGAIEPITVIAADTNVRTHPHSQCCNTATAGIAYETAAGESGNLKGSDLTYSVTQPQSDQFDITTDSSILDVDTSMRFYHDSIYVNVTIRNDIDDVVTATVPMHWNGLQINNDQRTRFRNEKGGSIHPYGNKADGSYPLAGPVMYYGKGIGGFAPVAAMWDDTFTFGVQVLGEFENPDYFEMQEVPKHQFTEYMSNRINVTLQPGEERRYSLVYSVAPGGDWETTFLPYKQWFTDKYGEAANYCAPGPFAFLHSKNSCNTAGVGFHDPANTACQYVPDRIGMRFRPDYSTTISAPANSDRMVTLGLENHGQWALSMLSTHLTMDGLPIEFSPRIDLLDTFSTAVPDFTALRDAINYYHQNDQQVFWFARPCADIEGADIDIDADGRPVITRGYRRSLDLRIKEHRERALAPLDFMLENGVDGFYLDAMSCPGDTEFAHLLKQHAQEVYGKELLIIKEGAIGAEASEWAQIPLLKTPAFSAENSLLIRYLTPWATFYGGEINRRLDATELQQVIDTGYQMVVGGLWSDAVLPDREYVTCVGLLRQNQLRTADCGYVDIPQYCCGNGHLPNDACGTFSTGICGDGYRNLDEECDDTSATCIDCRLVAGADPICGNGIIESGEQCDDANTIDTDRCSNSCLFVDWQPSMYSCPLPDEYWSQN